MYMNFLVVLDTDTSNMGRYVRKRAFRHKRPATIQISLRIRAVRSESSLGAFWIAKDAKCHHTVNEGSDQTVCIGPDLSLLKAHLSEDAFYNFLKTCFVYRLKRGLI